MEHKTHDKARLRPVAGHKRALRTAATFAPFPVDLKPNGGGKNAAAYTPAARRGAGSLRSVYVGERWHEGDYPFFTVSVKSDHSSTR